MKYLLSFVALFVAPLAWGGEELRFETDDLLGVWQTETTEEGHAHVEIIRVDRRYEGRIVWLSETHYDSDDSGGMGGREKIDRENPDPALRDRPIVGLRLLHSFRFDGKSKWTDGRIYDPENGKEYRCKLTMKDHDSLEIFGYVKVALIKLGRNTTWTRAPSGK